MNCTQCGKATADTDKFCKHCGAKVGATKPKARNATTARRKEQSQPATRPAINKWALLFGGLLIGNFLAFNAGAVGYKVLAILGDIAIVWLMRKRIWAGISNYLPRIK